MPLFLGSMFIRVRRYLNDLPLYGIMPDLEDNEIIIDMLDVAYIEPIFHIFKEHIAELTGHEVSFRGDGQTNIIAYEDTGAAFKYEILEYGNTDIDFYYNDEANNAEAIILINILEQIYRTHRFFELDAVAQERDRQTKEWLDSIRDNTDDDYTEEDDEQLWMEYMSEIHEGFEEWKAKRKPKADKGPDISAGTIAWFDGDHWNQLTGVTNVEVSMEDSPTFYADDTLYYNFKPQYEFSFNVDQVSEAFKGLVDNLTVELKKSQINSAPP